MSTTTKRPIAVLVVDDNPAFRREIAETVNRFEFVSVAQGTAASDMGMVASVLLSARDTVAIIDYDGCRRSMYVDPETWIRRLVARINPDANVHIFMIAKTSDEMLAVEIMKAGASDYLPKRLISGSLLRASLSQLARPLKAKADKSRRPAEQQFDDEARPNLHIDGYALERKLYESREAGIYLAHSEALNKSVVLKIVPYSTNTGLSLARFEREFESIRKVDNRAVAEVYDYGQTGKFSYMAIEHFPLGSLRDRMDGPLDSDSAVEYLRQIAIALREIHTLNIVHRDLKPPNIMRREDNTLALIDFGIVKDLGEGTGLTRHGELRGSPYYMSPEQATGQRIDARSDIYSLGIIFYEMLTGERPYSGRDLMDILSQHIEAPPPRLPKELVEYQRLVDSMMAKDWANRMPSVDELLGDSLFVYAGVASQFRPSRRA